QGLRPGWRRSSACSASRASRYSCSSGIIEIGGQKNSRDLRHLRKRGGCTGAFGAAFLDHEVDHAAHHVVVGMADEGSAFARLAHEADADQRLEMVREGGGGDVEPGLQAADR